MEAGPTRTRPWVLLLLLARNALSFRGDGPDLEVPLAPQVHDPESAPPWELFDAVPGSAAGSSVPSAARQADVLPSMSLSQAAASLKAVSGLPRTPTPTGGTSASSSPPASLTEARSLFQAAVRTSPSLSSKMSLLASVGQQERIDAERPGQPPDLPPCRGAAALRSDSPVGALVEQWVAQRPGAPVTMVHNGSRCFHTLALDSTQPTHRARPRPQHSVLVRHGSAPGLPPCCDGASKEALRQRSAPVQRQSFQLQDGQYRSYGAIWPKGRACSAIFRCPLIVVLPGLGENHGPWEMAFAEPLGLYARCPGCLEELHGVLLVLSLQINASAATKNWEWDGSAREVDDFVVPLVRHFLRENAPSLDPARVWLTGYSTGGAASLTAALRYPDVFSTALASQSCSFALTTAGRASAFDASRPDGVDPASVPARRLKAVTLAVGAQDSIISSQACVRALSDKLRSDNAGAKALGSAAVQLVVYADLGHVIWHDVYPQAFGSLWRAEGHETVLTWAVFISVMIVAMVTVGFEKRWGPREQPLEELLADGEDLDSLDRVVITNRFVLQAQRSLYGVAIVMVILSHWLPHDLSGIQTPGWTQVLLGILSANHATMGLVFVLTGYANAISARPTATGAREAVLLAVYLAMAWPTLFGSGIAVYHRWTLLWLVFYKMLLSLLTALQVPAPAQIACSVAAAWPLSETPDAFPRLWGPRAQGVPRPAPWDVTSLLFDDFFFWSLGHKAYWFAIYLAAHHYGPRLVQHLQANPDHLRVAMTPWWRCLAALLLLSAWLVQRSFELPFDPRLPPELGDWPGFFGSWRRSLANVALDLAQLALLVVAVGVGNTVLRMCGDSVLGTYITHAYVDPGLVGLVTSSSAFGSLGALPAVGGVLQLLIAVSFPVAYAMTAGRLCTCCFLAAARACQARCAGSRAPAGCQGAALGEESTMDDDEGQ